MHKILAPVLFLSTILLAGCAHISGPAENRATGPAKPVPPPSGETVELQYHILAGEMAIQRGQAVRAAKEYLAALKYSSDPELARRATRIALYAGKAELAYRAARIWAAGKPESIDAQRIAARLALSHGTAKALESYAARVVHNNAAGLGAGFRNLAHILGGQSQFAERALAVMRKLVGTHPDLAAAHYAYARLAMRYDAFEKAETQVDRALSLRPGWRQAVFLRAELLVRQDRIQAARQAVSALGDSRNGRARNQIAFARLLLEYGRNAEAEAAFERALSLDPGNANARYGLALLALTLHQPQRAKQALTALYESGHRANEAAYYLGGIAERRGDYAQARRWYQRVNGGQYQFEARIRAAVMRARLGKVTAALVDLSALHSTSAESSEQLILAKGRILLRAGRLDEALALYTRALRWMPHNPDLLYARSLVYARLGKLKKAEVDLRAVIDARPSAPRALNALGYMLSNHSSRYREALGYIRRALEARPGDPAILDSLGWVHYRMGHLHKALKYLRKAYRKFPEPEVAAHLGEVLWKLGKKQSARDIWQQASDSHPDNRVLQETVQRLAP